MKKIKLLTSILLLGLISLTVSAQDKKKTEDIIFKTSITCDNCVNTIMSALPLEKGIKNVKCDLETKEVKVTYRNDKTDEETVKRTIEKLGFTAVKSDKKEEKKSVVKKN